MAAEEVVHIKIANRKDLIIVELITIRGISEKNITISVNFRPFFQPFYNREWTLMLTKRNDSCKLDTLCFKTFLRKSNILPVEYKHLFLIYSHLFDEYQ